MIHFFALNLVWIFQIIDGHWRPWAKRNDFEFCDFIFIRVTTFPLFLIFATVSQIFMNVVLMMQNDITSAGVFSPTIVLSTKLV